MLFSQVEKSPLLESQKLCSKIKALTMIIHTHKDNLARFDNALVIIKERQTSLKSQPGLLAQNEEHLKLYTDQRQKVIEHLEKAEKDRTKYIKRNAKILLAFCRAENAHKSISNIATTHLNDCPSSSPSPSF